MQGVGQWRLRVLFVVGAPCLLWFGGTWNFDRLDRLQHPCLLLVGPAGVDVDGTSNSVLRGPSLCPAVHASRMEMDADASRSKRGMTIGEPHRASAQPSRRRGQRDPVLVRHEARDEAGSERPISICGRIRAEKFNLRFYIEPVRPYFWAPGPWSTS